MKGPFKTQQLAAEAAAELVGCEVAELRKPPTYSAEEWRERWESLIDIYEDGAEGPGDYEALVQHATTSKAMYAQEPALEWFSVWGKYGPFKDALRQQWSKISGPGSKVRGKSKAKAKAGPMLRVPVTKKVMQNQLKAISPAAQ